MEDAEENQENPYKDETFGFPRGTVQEKIAFTLLYGEITLLIVSFGLKGELQNSNLYASEIDFFKNAFLIVKSTKDWTHTGIITEIENDWFLTIDENTNDEGSREGYEVCERKRNFRTSDIDVYRLD